MTDEQKCLEWLKHRRDNMPMAGAKRMFGIAISALEKQEKDRWIPVIRCKDCKFRENDDFCTGRGFPYQLVPDDGFCDKGKRDDCTGII